MSFTPLLQCAKSLDFLPRRPWPHALPAMSWKGLLLCGFERPEGSAVVLTGNFQDAWIACHPTLGFSELSRFTKLLCKNEPVLFDNFIEGLMLAYGYRWNDRLEKTLQKVCETPVDFQSWLDEKLCGPRDIAALMAVDDLTPLKEILSAMTKMNLSKSLGVQALELIVDLYLMGTRADELMPSDSSGDLWLKKLNKWRKPVSGALDLEMKEKIDRLSWPSQVQAQWVRSGDESGVEIKLRVKSPDDFGNKLEKLSSVNEAWRYLKN